MPAMVELFDDCAVDRWTPLRAPFDETAARAYLDRARGHRAQGRGLQLAITTDGRRPLGEILLFPTGAPGEVELAYAADQPRGRPRPSAHLAAPSRPARCRARRDARVWGRVRARTEDDVTRSWCARTAAPTTAEMT